MKFRETDEPLKIPRVPSAEYLQKRGGVVLTFGVFDSFYVGHQQIIKNVRQRAIEIGSCSVALLFRPRPIDTLNIRPPFPYLTAQDQAIRLIKQLGVDYVGTVKFTKEITLMRPKIFLKRLVLRLPIKEMWLGVDAKFGRGPDGSLTSISRICNEMGIDVKVFSDDSLPTQNDLMNHFENKELREAAELLGRRYKLPAYIGANKISTRSKVKTYRLFTPELLYVPPDGEYAVIVHPTRFGGLKTHIKKLFFGVLVINTIRQTYSKPRLFLLSDHNNVKDSFVNLELITAFKKDPVYLLKWSKQVCATERQF